MGVDSLLSDYLGLKDFIQLFEMEELGASETHKTEILDFEVLTFKKLGRKFKCFAKMWVLWYDNIVRTLNF